MRPLFALIEALKNENDQTDKLNEYSYRILQFIKGVEITENDAVLRHLHTKKKIA